MRVGNQRRSAAWLASGLASYVAHHPRAADRITPLGVPLAVLVALADGRRRDLLPSLVELSRLDASAFSDERALESQAAAFFVGFYALVVARRRICDLGELEAALRGLSRDHLAEFEAPFAEHLAAFAALGERIGAAGSAFLQAESRLRAAHTRFAEVALTTRHREEARLHRERRPGQAPRLPSESLRDVPARLERSLARALTRITVAARDLAARDAELYCPTSWPALPSLTGIAHETTLQVRGELEASLARLAEHRSLARAGADLRTAAGFAAQALEAAHRALGLDAAQIAQLRRAIGSPEDESAPRP